MYETETSNLYNECRELIAYRMSSSMSRVMGYIENVLVKMSSEAGSTAESAHYIEAAEEVRGKKREIQTRFEDRFFNIHPYRESFPDTDEPDDDPSSDDFDFLPVKLFQKKKEEITISIDRAADKMREECRIALATLDYNVKALFEKEKIGQIVDTMQPATVLDAFWNSFYDIREDVEIRFLLIHMFERYIVNDLRNVYDDLNTLFEFYQSGGGLSDDDESETHHDNDPEYTEMNVALYPNLTIVRAWVKNEVETRINAAIEKEVVKSIRSSAAKGDPTSQYQLGTLYYHGRGVVQDHSEAALWYRRAAEQGNVDAQYSLGNMYLLGDGVPQNDQQTRYWYNEAAAQGHNSAKEVLKKLQQDSGDRSALSPAGPAVKFFREPEFIHRFLFEIWVPVLIHIYEKYGCNSIEWQSTMEVIDNLIHWLNLANDGETGSLQKMTMSALINQLKHGMKTIHLPSKIQADFLSKLKTYQIQITELNHG